MQSVRPTDGEAQLHVASVLGRSAVVCSWAKSPLCLLAPRASGPSVWAYTSSYGGGMVAGDQTSLQVRVDPQARCFLGTQASTKVYRNPAGLPCSHHLSATLSEESLLVLAPDPVQCFANSSYEQRQDFLLAESANLIVVDWLSAGRTARGERWAFSRYASRNQIQRGGKTICLDSLLLDQRNGDLTASYQGRRFNCLGTIILVGPLVAPAAREALEWLACQPVGTLDPLVMTGSPLREGALIRFAAPGVQEAAEALSQRLSFVRTLLEGDPWARKW